MKPLFFDAAWNYIEYPGRGIESVAKNGVDDVPTAVAAKGQDQTPQQKKGWFGFGR